MNNLTENMQKLRLDGKTRVKIENKLLTLLFNGFTSLTFDKSEYQTMLFLFNTCDLNLYSALTKKRGNTVTKYQKLSAQSRICFDVFQALDKLVERGLVSRKTVCSVLGYEEDGLIDIEGSREATPFYDRSQLADALFDDNKLTFKEYDETYPEDNNCRMLTLENIEYKLTSKGYDVALTFQKHAEDKKQATKQRRLTKKAAAASVSSAKTAKVALLAASFIAFSSITNVILGLINYFSENPNDIKLLHIFFL